MWDFDLSFAAHIEERASVFIVDVFDLNDSASQVVRRVDQYARVFVTDVQNEGRHRVHLLVVANMDVQGLVKEWIQIILADLGLSFSMPIIFVRLKAVS